MNKTLEQQIQEYVFGYSKLKGHSEETIHNKKTFFGRLSRFLNGKPLSLETARDYILTHTIAGNSGNTIATEIRYLRAFNHWQVSMDYAELWADKMEQPKQEQTKMNILRDDVLAEIIHFGTEPRPFKPGKSGDHAGHVKQKMEARAALTFIRLHGTRVGETLGIKCSALKLNDEQPSLWLTRKGGKNQYFPVHADFVEELRKRQNTETGKVFNVSAELLRICLKRGAAMMGISEHLVTHSLRHSFATNKIREGEANLQMVKRILNHSSIEITDKLYSHFNNKDLAKVINSNAVLGFPIEDKLDDIRMFAKEKVRKDPRMYIEEASQMDLGTEIELVIRVRAKKPIQT